MPVNLRSVVDMENINDIINLARFLDKKGWLDLPPELFKTQLGRNYELFECYAKPQHLMTQVELWGKFASLSKEYPVLAKFHRPDFKGIRHLVDTAVNIAKKVEDPLRLASRRPLPGLWLHHHRSAVFGARLRQRRRRLRTPKPHARANVLLQKMNATDPERAGAGSQTLGIAEGTLI
jgi:hypothetical protein